MRRRSTTLAGALLAPVVGLAAVVLPGASTAVATAPAPAPPSAKAQATIAAPALAFARKQLGTPYRWGGTGPGGYDCSGLAYAAYQAAGIRLPRTSQQQFDGLPHVRIADLQPGDLVFYGTRASRTPPPSPKPSPSPSQSATHKPTPTPSPTRSHRPSPTPSPTHTRKPSPKPTPSMKPKVTPTPVSRRTASPTPKPAPSTSPTPKPKPSGSPAPSPTPTPPQHRRAKVHHVGIYIGDGQMIDAPHTGDVVRIQPIDRPDLIRRGARPSLQLRLPIARGQVGFSVVQAQRLLALADPSVSVDGGFGASTYDALVNFQKAHGLTVTGHIALPTWVALVDAEGLAAAKAVGNTPKHVPPPPGSTKRKQLVAPYRSTVLRRGDTGKAVEVLQELLGGLAVDGDFGPATEAAVNDFKSAHKLKPNGVVGTKTWDALAKG